MSRPGLDAVEALVSFPRVSGDEPAFWQVRRDERGFSPRERG